MSRLSSAWPVLAGDTAADALVYVTLGWLAVQTGELSGSAVLAANTIPAIALMLVGSAVADRLGVVRVATWSTAIRAGVLVGFAALVAAGVTGTVTLLLVAFLLGIIDAVHQPAIYGVVAILAEKGKQRSSQAMVVGVTRSVGVLGAVLGGVLIGKSTDLPLSVAAGCLLVAAVGAARVPRELPGDDEQVEESSSLWGMALEGVRSVRRDRIVIGVLGLFTVANFAATAPLALGVPFMAEQYGWGGWRYGAVYAGFGLGQVVGGGTFAFLARRGVVDEAHLGLGTSAALLVPAATCLAVLSQATSVALAAAAIAGAGLFLAPGAVILMGYVRERTPARLQGRINGLISLSITASVPFGMLVFGLLVSVWDVELAIVSSAAALGVAAAVALVAAARSAEGAAPGGDVLMGGRLGGRTRHGEERQHE